MLLGKGFGGDHDQKRSAKLIGLQSGWAVSDGFEKMGTFW